MAKKPNNTNFDNLFSTPNTMTTVEANQRAEARAIGKVANKKTHVSVLLDEADFEYVREICYERRISKNEFFKELLNEYRNKH